jgi:hypothetical protein
MKMVLLVSIFGWASLHGCFACRRFRNGSLDNQLPIHHAVGETQTMRIHATDVAGAQRVPLLLQQNA